jgi:hypothetical protein
MKFGHSFRIVFKYSARMELLCPPLELTELLPESYLSIHSVIEFLKQKLLTDSFLFRSHLVLSQKRSCLSIYSWRPSSSFCSFCFITLPKSQIFLASEIPIWDYGEFTVRGVPDKLGLSWLFSIGSEGFQSAITTCGFHCLSRAIASLRRNRVSKFHFQTLSQNQMTANNRLIFTPRNSNRYSAEDHFP